MNKCDLLEKLFHYSRTFQTSNRKIFNNTSWECGARYSFGFYLINSLIRSSLLLLLRPAGDTSVDSPRFLVNGDTNLNVRPPGVVRFFGADRRIHAKEFFSDSADKALFMLPDLTVVAPIHYGIRIVRSSADTVKTQLLNLVNPSKYKSGVVTLDVLV